MVVVAKAIEDRRIDQSEYQQLAVGDLTGLEPLPLLVQDEQIPPVRRQLGRKFLEQGMHLIASPIGGDVLQERRVTRHQPRIAHIVWLDVQRRK